MPRGIPGSGGGNYGITINANVKGQKKIKELGNSMQGVQGRAKNLAGAFKGLAKPLALIGLAVGTFKTLQSSFRVVAEREADFATLANGLERVTTNAPVAAKALRGIADELGFETLFDEKEFQKGFALLTSFKNIGVDSYSRVAETAADLAQINQTDLKSSFLQLAKALSDPTRGLTALSRSGVIFTETQREMILELHNSGRAMEAQAEILKIVEGSYKGAARAAAEGLAGAFDTLGQKFRDFNEALGGAAEPFLEPLVEAATDLFDVVTLGLNAISDDLELFAKNIERALSPIFKWIVGHLGNIFKLMDEMFAKWSNLEKLRIKLGADEYAELRDKLFKQASEQALQQQPKFVPDDNFVERVTGVVLNPMKIFKPIIKQFENSKEFRDLRENIFDDLVENAAVKELGIFETVIPVLDDVNLKFDDQKNILKGLVKPVEDVGDGLTKTFGQEMQSKLTKFSESIKTVEESMADVVIGGIKKMEDSLLDFVTTGKLNFKDLANSIIKDMARIAIQQSFTKNITGWFSGLSLFGGGRAMGGPVGANKSYLVGEQGPEILRMGNQSGNITPNHKLGGMGSTSVVVNVDASGGSEVEGDEGQARVLGKVVAMAVKNQIANERRPGGLLYA